MNPKKNRIAKEDVDDVIEIAARADDADDDSLSLDELQDIGEELGIDGEHVAAAALTLEERRAAESAGAQLEAHRRKKLLSMAGSVLFGALLIFVVLGLTGRAELVENDQTVQQQRAQLQNVLERQRAVQDRYQGAALTVDAEAELAGSLNRVSIERRRYDEAAAAYNETSASFLGLLGHVFCNLPQTAEFSSKTAD